MKKIFLVLGMHRSATSLTAGLLFNYGLYTGEDEELLKTNENNQYGFFENKNVFLLNEMILSLHNMTHWSYIYRKIDLIKKTKYVNEIRDTLYRLSINSKKENIFIKDPRMCITEPVWRKEIQKSGLEENIIIVFRHPFEVARSLQKRDNLNFVYSLKLWFYYNLSILYCIAGSDVPVLVLNHENYFNSKTQQIIKLEDFIQYEGLNNKARNFIESSLRHNIAGNIENAIDSELEDMVFKLYEYLKLLSNNNNVSVLEKDLEQYSLYLEKMEHTSYDVGQEDIKYLQLKDNNGRGKKMWCIYQLYNKKDLLVLQFKDYFEKTGVIDIYIYGNGTISKFLIPILQEVGLKIEKIFDRDQKNISDLKSIKQKTYIINTVVNYGNGINQFLSEYFEISYILDMYTLLSKMEL